MKINGNNEIVFILDRFEGNKAVLGYDGQELVVPRKSVSKLAQEGDAVHGEFLLEKEYSKRREDVAKALLEEILGGE